METILTSLLGYNVAYRLFVQYMILYSVSHLGYKGSKTKNTQKLRFSKLVWKKTKKSIFFNFFDKNVA